MALYISFACKSPQKPGENFPSSQTGVTGGCQFFDVDAED